MSSPPTHSNDSSLSPEVQAWKRFCQRVEALGERILAGDFPNQPADVTEGIAHLAEQVSCWLD